MAKKTDKLNLSKEAKILALRAETALEEGIARLSGYESGEELKTALIRILNDHPEFNHAVNDLHVRHKQGFAKQQKSGPVLKKPVARIRSELMPAHRPEERRKPKGK